RVTDDATIVEEAGFFIDTVQGSENNIKITHYDDLKIAEAILN
ncbi:2-C-methyl-D-erythritol 4-phosphate cytidylyltransferase, partial [Winogradskyella sp.]